MMLIKHLLFLPLNQK